MSSQSIAIGTETAVQLQPPSEPVVISAKPLLTVHDLLNAIDPPTSAAKKLPGLWTAAMRFSVFANLAIDKLPIEALLDVSGEFATYLKQHHYKVNSVRTYCQNARLLH